MSKIYFFKDTELKGIKIKFKVETSWHEFNHLKMLISHENFQTSF